MKSLIEKLEAAEAGSRELDAEIFVVLRPERTTHPKLPVGYTIRDEGDDNKNRLRAESQFIHKDRGPSPHYTTSLDAALTLVPEGWAWMLTHVGKLSDEHGKRDFVPEARLWIPSQRTKGLSCEQIQTAAPTPALALCIAAIKARDDVS